VRLCHFLSTLLAFLTCCFSLVHAQLGVPVVLPSSGTIINHAHRMLYVDGIKLRDSSGEEVFLRGIQVDRNEKMKKYGSTAFAIPGEPTWFTQDDVERISKAGGNCIELHIIHLHEIMPERNIIDESFFSNWLDYWVSWCKQYEVYCIINIRGFAATETQLQRWGLVMPNWLWQGLYSKPTDMDSQARIIHDFWDTDIEKQEDNRQAFVNAWMYIADRYKNSPHVIFSIINEPLAHTHMIMNSISARHLGETYNIVMTQAIDAIRNTGAQQVIFVDRPYVWGLSNVQPIDRPNIAWEDHLYVTQHTTIEEWKDIMDNKVQKFVYDFRKPLFIGEYGTDRPTKPTDIWQSALSEQVAYLKTKSICGQLWNHFGVLEGEYSDFVFDYYNAEESEWLLACILS